MGIFLFRKVSSRIVSSVSSRSGSECEDLKPPRSAKKEKDAPQIDLLTSLPPIETATLDTALVASPQATSRSSSRSSSQFSDIYSNISQQKMLSLNKTPSLVALDSLSEVVSQIIESNSVSSISESNTETISNSVSSVSGPATETFSSSQYSSPLKSTSASENSQNVTPQKQSKMLVTL